MLRKILIVIGFAILIDPYLGFPAEIDKFILSGLGLLVILLLTVSKRGRIHHDQPKVLHVERTLVEDSPEVHIERNIVEDTEEIAGSFGDETTIEKKVSVTRRRKKRSDEGETLQDGDT